MAELETKKVIQERVHNYYWEKDINCARTMLLCLGELFQIEYDIETVNAAIGLHGAGGFRAQCGLVEGALMFTGVYYSKLGKTEQEITSICYRYAEAFQERFGSLRCSQLRPNGFQIDDQPHLCEEITCRAIEFAYDFFLEMNRWDI